MRLNGPANSDTPIFRQILSLPSLEMIDGSAKPEDAAGAGADLLVARGNCRPPLEPCSEAYDDVADGVETQRQWSDMAITRTKPCLLNLFSIVTLPAARPSARRRRRAAA